MRFLKQTTYRNRCTLPDEIEAIERYEEAKKKGTAEFIKLEEIQKQ